MFACALLSLLAAGDALVSHRPQLPRRVARVSAAEGAAPSPAVGSAPPAAEAVPPQTMAQCLAQAQAATVQAIQDGIRIMEVEFPPLPADRLDQPDTSAYDISKANTDLAVSFASGLEKQMGKRVAILYPDVAELERVAASDAQTLLRRAIEDKLSDEPAAGVTLHSMRKPYVLAELGTVFSAIFGGKGELMIQPVPDADVYVCLTFSAQELPDVEALCVKEKFDKPVILFNLKLDTQRGDLGLPAFPPKDLQWRFLSRVVPVYYLRTRQYSISMPKPPFVVNYQGAIFRQYPGRYQSLLDTGKNYRPVEIQSRRPALGEFKEILTNALRLGETGELATFARTGFKSITWWEEDKGKEELFDDWRR